MGTCMLVLGKKVISPEKKGKSKHENISYRYKVSDLILISQIRCNGNIDCGY